MISPEARSLNESFRKDLRESGLFTQPTEAVRTAWDEFGATIPEYSSDVRIESVNTGSASCEWVTLPGSDRGRVILHFHGGGYVIGHPSGYRNYNARVAEAAGARVLAVDYRLAPEHPHPAAIEDTLGAYRWVLDQGIAPENVGFHGESAGGGLVMGTMLAAKQQGLPLPGAAIAVSPWIDLTLSGDSHDYNRDAEVMMGPSLLAPWAEAYLDGADPKTPTASPLFGDLEGLPPTYLLVGSTEILLDDARAMFMKLSRSGVDTTIDVAHELPHVWPVFAYQLPEGRSAIQKMGAFFRAHLG